MLLHITLGRSHHAAIGSITDFHYILKSVFSFLFYYLSSSKMIIASLVKFKKLTAILFAIVDVQKRNHVETEMRHLQTRSLLTSKKQCHYLYLAYKVVLLSIFFVLINNLCLF